MLEGWAGAAGPAASPTRRLPPDRPTTSMKVLTMQDRPPLLRWLRARSLVLAGLCAALLGTTAAGQQAVKVPADHAERMAKGQELFRKHVRQILTDRCLKCHGGEKTRADLDLTTREGLLKGGDNGPAVVPYSAKQSRLYKLITHQQEPHMPAKEAKLPDAQVAQLAAWIDLGAPYDRPLVEKAARGKKPMTVTDKDRAFWAFRPLQQPAPPRVRNESWCKTPIDRFILARLEEHKLDPNPAVDRRTLIRRAYFDLIGLPPPPEEVEKFVRDPAPDAYGRLLDRLLEDPHHGEKWARHWLDVARFAESSGYEHDYDRPHAYHYRDFVIKAFNRDLPYNTFVKWQIAGDEYEPDNPLALTATGFLAAGTHSTQITKNLVEKERYEQLDDKLRTLGTAMLGLTVGCARCHDHKYDPIPTRDYYRMLSTFTTTVKSNVDVNLDPEGYRKAKAEHDALRARLLAPVMRYEKERLPQALDAFLVRQAKDTVGPRWVILEPVSARSQGGATLTPQDDGSLLAGGKNPDFDTYTFVVHTHLRGITAVQLNAFPPDPSDPLRGAGRADNGNFALSDFRVTAAPLRDPGKAVAVKLINPRATFEQKGFPVRAAIDGDKKTAWAIAPLMNQGATALFQLESPAGFEGGTVLTFTLEFKNNKRHAIARPCLSVSTAVPAPADFGGDTISERALRALQAVRANGPTALAASERAALLRWYRTYDFELGMLRCRVIHHDWAAPRPNVTKVLIASEGVPPLRMHTQGADFFEQTYFLKRGDVDQKDGVATQGFLQVLTRHPDAEKHWQTPPPKGWRTSYRRRALAEWVTDVDHGAGHLLARVIVNRLWQHHMGRGIVGTPSDFGFQGEPPTHPELLDWLARELIRNGWRLRPIHKLIMTSAVYRQSADRPAAKVKADSENRLFWHRPRQRLQAELIRDAMLTVSGTLDPRPFGPGTLDPKHKRRSIYFFVKRSKLVPQMVLFDAPDALQGMDRRPTTTVAPQALLVLNGPAVRGFAEAFARRVSPQEATPLPDAVRSGYRIALGREPTRDELKDSVEFVQEQLESYRADRRGDARQAALADFCQVLLGLNEFIYVD
jgi:mono/diheme cytochrome c family protein